MGQQFGGQHQARTDVGQNRAAARIFSSRPEEVYSSLNTSRFDLAAFDRKRPIRQADLRLDVKWLIWKIYLWHGRPRPSPGNRARTIVAMDLTTTTQNLSNMILRAAKFGNGRGSRI